jgi:hypothetical protein
MTNQIKLLQGKIYQYEDYLKNYFNRPPQIIERVPLIDNEGVTRYFKLEDVQRIFKGYLQFLSLYNRCIGDGADDLKFSEFT